MYTYNILKSKEHKESKQIQAQRIKMSSLKNEINALRNEFQREINTLKEQILVIKNNNQKKKHKISQSLRELCWNTYVGKAVGITKCPCCGISDITPFNFNCRHIITYANGGKTSIENLRPICSGCNKSIGSENMDVFKQKYFG